MPRGFAKVAEDIAEVRQELKSDLEAVRSELKEEIAAVRTELKGEIADLRTDMRDGFASIHEELGDIRQRLETLEEAARNAAGLTNRYGYPASFIARLIRNGKVSGHHVGRNWYVDLSSLQAHLATFPKL